MTIEWWVEAKEDLDLIYEYLAELNEKYAIKVYNTILDEVDNLLIYAESLAIEFSIKSEKYLFRSSIVINGKYKIIYFIDGPRIIITHIWDCRRDSNTIRQYLN